MPEPEAALSSGIQVSAFPFQHSYPPAMIWFWAGFLVFVVAMLALDLGVFHRKAHVVGVKEALIWSAVWVALSLAFCGVVYPLYEYNWAGFGLYAPETTEALNPYLYPTTGARATLAYLSGYLTEKSLSVDNIFVIALVFGTFKIPDRYQHRVLFWGILGAIVLRGIFILVGAELLKNFAWIIYIFGAFLVITAVRLLFAGHDDDPKDSFAVRMAYKYLPVTDQLHGEHFLINRSELGKGETLHGVGDPDRAADVDLPPDAPPADTEAPDTPPPGSSTAEAAKKAGYVLTPLGLALLVVEFTDLVFAVDSIPAIFGITGDAFIVFTSNIFAILGLRALYFALAGVIRQFRYLQPALAFVLGFIGVKMLLAHWLHGHHEIAQYLPWVTLGVITLAITTGVVASLMFPAKPPEPGSAEGGFESVAPPPTPRT